MGPSSISISKTAEGDNYSAVCVLSGRQSDGGGWQKYFQVQFTLRNGSVSDPVEAAEYVVYKEHEVLKRYYGEDGYKAIRLAMMNICAGKVYSRALAIEDVLEGIVK